MALRTTEIIASAETRIGLICLWRRELPSHPDTIVTEITLDHTFLMSSLFAASERAFALRAAELHPVEGARVLVGGLGLGHTAHAVLEDPRVARAEVIELLPEVIGWLERGLFTLTPALQADARFSVTPGDIYRLLAGSPARVWDRILIDVDHSPDRPLDPANASFYTEDGLARARAHLAPGGLLGVWSSGESPVFAEAMRASFRDVCFESVTAVNPKLGEEETNWLYFGLT